MIRWFSPTIRRLEAALIAAEARCEAANERAARAEERYDMLTRKTIDGLARLQGSKGFFEQVEEPAGEPMRVPLKNGQDLIAQAEREFFEAFSSR